MGAIEGYTFDAPDLPHSPVNTEELEDLARAVGLDADDHAALTALWGHLDGRLEDLFGVWFERIGHFFVPTFAGPDGTPDERYLAAAHVRFLRWVEDTCTRPYDQAWLDYQYEIGLRHHRTRKNVTDGVRAAEIVAFRYLPVTIVPMANGLRAFLRTLEVDADEVERLVDAFAKTLALQVALWSHPYVIPGDW